VTQIASRDKQKALGDPRFESTKDPRIGSTIIVFRRSREHIYLHVSFEAETEARTKADV
jgi:hypothetical protein